MDDMQQTFTKEREFFLQETQKGQNNEDDLKSIIINLENQIKDE